MEETNKQKDIADVFILRKMRAVYAGRDPGLLVGILHCLVKGWGTNFY